MEYIIASRQAKDTLGHLRRFHYALLVDIVRAGRFHCEVYGIRVWEEGGDSVSLSNLSTDAREVDRLMALLVEHNVGPAGAADVAADCALLPLPRMA